MSGQIPSGVRFTLEVAAVMAAQSASIANTVQEALVRQAYEQWAARCVIVERVAALVSGPYMPTPAAIESVLYPSQRDVEMFLDEVRPSWRTDSYPDLR